MYDVIKRNESRMQLLLYTNKQKVGLPFLAFNYFLFASSGFNLCYFQIQSTSQEMHEKLMQ